jgi:hypothetical protein
MPLPFQASESRDQALGALSLCSSFYWEGWENDFCALYDGLILVLELL